MSTREKELLATKEKEIQEMRRKIAEFEAKKKGKKGSHTPNQAAATPSEGNDSESSGANAPRASSVSVDKVDGPSAQLISEAVSAELPQPSEPATTNNDQGVAGLQPPRVKSAKEEKKKRLAALREARDAKLRELREQAEARLREEEARLRALEDEMEIDEGSDDEDNQSEHMSIEEQPEEEAPIDDDGKQIEDSQGKSSPLIMSRKREMSTCRQTGLTFPAVVGPLPSMPETREEAAIPAPATGAEAGDQGQLTGATTDSQDSHMSGLPDPVGDAKSAEVETDGGHHDESRERAITSEEVQPSASTDGHQTRSSSQQHVDDVRMVEEVPVSVPMPDYSMDNATAESRTTNSGQADPDAQPDACEPSEAMATDSADHVAMSDSPEFSPEPAGDRSSNTDGYVQPQSGERAVPATISDVPQLRDEQQEIEGPVTGEVLMKFA